jgi:hypothetical protein
MTERAPRLQQHELENLRRSLAMSDSLPKEQMLRVIDECAQLAAERVHIERVLGELGPAWGGTRHALNELYRILRAPSERGARAGTLRDRRPSAGSDHL